MKPAAEGGVAPLLAATPEEVAVINLYTSAQAHEAPTTPNASLLEQATRELATADQEAVAAAEKQRIAQKLLTKTPALSPATYGGQVDLAGPERTGGFTGGASSSSFHGLGGGLSGGGGDRPFGASSSSSHGRGGGLSGGGGAGLLDLGDEGARLTLAEASASQPVGSTSGSIANQPHPHQEFFTQAVVGTQEKPRVLSEQYFKHHSEKEAPSWRWRLWASTVVC